MKESIAAAAVFLSFSRICHGTFFLLDPPIHNNLDSQNVYPCGGYKPAKSEQYQDYPINGVQLHVNSSESSGDWSFEYKLEDNSSWANLRGGNFSQHHTTDFCLQPMSVPSDVVGNKGLVRMTQNTETDTYYMCIPVSFTPESKSIPQTCGTINSSLNSTNSSGISNKVLNSEPAHTGIDANAKAVVIGMCVGIIVLFVSFTAIYALNRRRKRRKWEISAVKSNSYEEEPT